MGELFQVMAQQPGGGRRAQQPWAMPVSPFLDRRAGIQLTSEETRVTAGREQIQSTHVPIESLVYAPCACLQVRAQRTHVAGSIHNRHFTYDTFLSAEQILKRPDCLILIRIVGPGFRLINWQLGVWHNAEHLEYSHTMIAQTIQLALAPVFVLVAVGNIMNLLSSRLGRVVDRSRHLQERYVSTSGAEHDAVVREIRLVNRRIQLINRALLLLVSAGVCIGFTVAVLFIEELASTSLQAVAAGVFILAVGLLMWALLLFLRETQLATEALRIPANYLELERKL